MSENKSPAREGRANLEWYRKAAKKKLKLLRAERPEATLAEAQLAVARAHHFPSWRALKAGIDKAASTLTRIAVPAWTVDALPEHRRHHKIAQWKPIMDAAFRGDAAEVAKLLAAGADPNVLSTTPHRHRPLHRAIERRKTSPRTASHVAVVKLLLERGADPTLRGTHGQHTALQLAAIDSPVFVPALIGRFKPLDIFHATVLLDVERVKALLKRDPTLATQPDVNHWTPLHYAAASAMYQLDARKANAQAAIVSALIDSGAAVNATYVYNSEWPISVLFYACGYHDNPRLTGQLLQAGANPCDGESVYHASDEKHADCLAVIEKHTDPKLLATECTKCLSTQLAWGRTAGAKWLLDHGADPNAIHKRTGRSALQAAAANGASQNVIALLLRHGGDPTLKSKDGLIAIELARQKGKSRVVQQLQSI